MTPEQIAEAEKMAYEAEALVRQISKLLAGRNPGVIGAALADLTSMWVAGHYPAELRDPLLLGWIETVRGLVPVNEQQNLVQLRRQAKRLMVEAALSLTRLSPRLRRAVKLVLLQGKGVSAAARDRRVRSDRRLVHRAVQRIKPKLALIRAQVRRINAR